MTQSGPPPGGSRGEGQQSWQSQPRQPAPPPPPPPSSWASGMTSTAPVPGPAGFYYADVPNRVIAYIIDIIVLAIIGFLVSVVIGGVLGGVVTGANELNLGAFFIVGLINMAISAGYFVYMWSAQRATVGMKVLGLQIGHEQDGRSIDMQQGFMRWLVLGIPSILATFASYVSAGLGTLLSLVGIVWLIALLWSIASSQTKQGYHDRFARTIMVKAARRAA
jgi:uncharacterized RDD family membrane protein YckC